VDEIDAARHIEVQAPCLEGHELTMSILYVPALAKPDLEVEIEVILYAVHDD